MPGWPSPGERRSLDAFPGQVGAEDLEEHFKLSPADLQFVLGHRGDGRLGVAVVVCALRCLGFVPDNLGELPEPALLALCDQLEADPRDLASYGTRAQTRTDQFAAARAHARFRAFDEAEAQWLERWLVVRAMEHERPKALFTLACEQLRCRRVVRCSVDQLVRLIGAAREQAHQATFDALASQLADRHRRDRVDGLLRRQGDGKTTWIEWLRTPARDHQPAEIVRQLEKFTYLKELGAASIDLSMLPPGRVRILANEGRRRPAWELFRLAASRRLAVLLAFCSHTLVERGDELIDLYSAGIQNAERHARAAVKGEREQTARARDDHAWLGKTLARILVDALRRAGVAAKDIYVDHASGAKASRPEFDNILRILRDGDTLKITRLDRLGRSVLHLVTLGAELRDRGVGLHMIERGIDTSTAEGRAMFGMLSVLAGLQRELIIANAP